MMSWREGCSDVGMMSRREGWSDVRVMSWRGSKRCKDDVMEGGLE